MKIINIKKSSNNQYIITLDNKIKKKLYDDVILKSGLLYKKEIDENELEILERESEKQSAYYNALNLISKKMRSKKEILDFLEKKEIEAEEQEKIILRLENNKLLNDDLFARAYTQDRLLLSTDGPNKVRDNLLKQDIDLEIINKYINNYPEEEIYNKAEKLISKKIKKNTNKSLYALKQHILLEMINLGYEREMVCEILDKVSVNNNEQAVNKEYQKLYRKLSSTYNDDSLDKQIYYKLRSKGFSDEEIEKVVK